MFKKLKSELSLQSFVLILSGLNFLFFHYGFFKFVFSNVDYTNFSGLLLVISLFILVVVANAFAFFLILFLLRIVGKIILAITFIISAVASYFVNTYNIIVDESMIGNVLNTNYDESSAFFSWKMVIYLIFLGILPVIFIFITKIVYPSAKRFFARLGIVLLFILLMVGINAKSVLWIDKNSKHLGGLAMPWAYAVNTTLFYVHKNQENRKEILLPKATISNKEKSVVVLIIGESARSANFSLYGYAKNTNPLLSKMENLFHFRANSCATYTTAGLKCILEHENTNDLYEILPNYLHRNGVEVIWRTTNWGEPPVHIPKYQRAEDLKSQCEGEGCDYDEILLSGLADEIRASNKDKILVVLHTSTSHGPTYNKKYPIHFEHFKPVCNSVELANCSPNELINAYDNTIVYTDYLLAQTIEKLKELTDYKSTMLYVSDHGESLGENNLYMHGLPMSLAPKEQYDIPFIVWTSDKSKNVKKEKEVSQHHIFHSVLNFLSVKSPIYKPEMSVFE